MNSKIIVTVNEGKIKGIKNKSMFSGTEFYSFYGVPYGQPTGKTARYKVYNTDLWFSKKLSYYIIIIHYLKH